MARMHTRRHGRSASKRPAQRSNPEWVRYRSGEVENIIHKLAREGLTASRIGLVLRDQYGIPDIKSLTGKTLLAILKEKRAAPEVPDDLMDLIKKSVKIKTHIEENGQDTVSKRALSLTESKIRRLVSYYKENGRLAADWTYDPAKIKLLIQ
jgi:small subunit ribosomal protein S15